MAPDQHAPLARIDPYRAVGLRRNPFAFGPDGRDPGPFIDHLGIAVPHPVTTSMVQLIGDRGSGKSSHLHHWAVPRGLAPFHIEPGAPFDPPVAELCFWDEADRLPNRRLTALLEEAALRRATVVVGTHRDLSEPARRAGLRVQTVVLPTLDVDLLRAFVETRWKVAALDGRPSEALIHDTDLTRLLAQGVTTLREAGDRLHILVAERARAVATD